MPSNDLFINTHLDELISITETLKPISSYRHSVHVSPESPGLNTIHNVTEYADGTKDEKHLVSEAVYNDRFQPIYARSVAHPKLLKSLHPSPKDKVLFAPDYNPDRCTMHYAVYITSSAAWDLLPKDFPFQICMIPFRQFCVVVPAAYSMVPTPEYGRMSEYVTTSKERRSPEHSALGLRTGPAEGATIRSAVGSMVYTLNDVLTSKFGEFGVGKDHTPAGVQYPKFSANPLI